VVERRALHQAVPACYKDDRDELGVSNDAIQCGKDAFEDGQQLKLLAFEEHYRA
jgi:hypothetical protein